MENQAISNQIDAPTPTESSGKTEKEKHEEAPQPQLSAASTNSSQAKKKDYKFWSILSVIATIVPIILWIYCWIYSGGSSSENGPGAVWWLVVIYYWTIGIPLALIAIIFGAIGLKTSLRWLSIVSLILKAIMIIAILLLILFSSIH